MRWFRFCSPAGLLIFGLYKLASRIWGEPSDAVAYPIMIVSIVLMLMGCFYTGRCLGKGENMWTKPNCNNNK